MNRERFIYMVSEEQESLRRFLLALCGGDRDESEEIAQTAIIKAYLASEKFIEKYRFSTWLFKIAYNVYLDRKRSKRVYSKIENEIIIGKDEADAAFRYEELYIALEQLPEKEKTAILLYYIKGYDIKQIAEITDGSAIAVKTRLSRGREKLRRILENG